MINGFLNIFPSIGAASFEVVWKRERESKRGGNCHQSALPLVPLYNDYLSWALCMCVRWSRLVVFEMPWRRLVVHVCVQHGTARYGTDTDSGTTGRVLGWGEGGCASGQVIFQIIIYQQDAR